MTEGRIELRSGEWKWTITDLEMDASTNDWGTRPEGEVDPDRARERRTVLLLQDPIDPQHRMTRELDRAPDADLAEDELRDLARDPDRRQFVDPDGTIWKVEKIARPEPVREGVDFEGARRKVRISSPGGPPLTASLPENQPLGALTRDEMTTLVGD